MKKAIAQSLLFVLLAGAAVLAGCSSMHAQEGRQQGDRSFLVPYHGKVLVLLMGREGCPGTANATEYLDTYAPSKPAKVEILRLDVPLPGEDLKLAGDWQRSFPRRLDTKRAVADELEFFFYPTLYVFDPDGELRYSGGCDGAKLNQMIAEVLVEQPGQPKKSYNLPMPKPGEAAPQFSGALLSGEAKTLAGLKGQKGTLLIFARTGCPLTVDALPSVRGVMEAFRKHSVNVVVINNGEDIDQISQIYGKHVPKTPVVWDQDGGISKTYGVDVTPYFFLLDQNGKIVKHRSFTPQAATGAMNAMLGIAAENPRYSPKAAG